MGFARPRRAAAKRRDVRLNPEERKPMFDDPRRSDATSTNKQADQGRPLDPNGRRCERSGNSTHDDLGEVLDGAVYAALVQRLNAAFPEYVFCPGPVW